MSIEFMNWCWKEADVNKAELLVLLSLADQANDNGECYPFIKSIAKRTRSNEATVHRNLKKLENEGIIEISKHNGRGNHYKILALQNAISQNASQPTHKMQGLHINHQETPLQKSNKKEQKPRPRDLIHDALSEVTNVPAGSFNGMVASELKKANPDKSREWIADEVVRRFGIDGPWYRNDFRGKNGFPPTPKQVSQEWNRVLGPVVVEEQAREVYA